MKVILLLGAILVGLLARELLSGSDELAPVAVPNDAEATLVARVQSQVDRSAVKAKLAHVRTALYMYNAESGDIPAGFGEVIQQGYLTAGDVRDPWGRDFAFRSEKKASSNAFTEAYEIFVYSAGPDGVPDNGDDVFL